jgi:hypothetical protein
MTYPFSGWLNLLFKTEMVNFSEYLRKVKLKITEAGKTLFEFMHYYFLELSLSLQLYFIYSME